MGIMVRDTENLEKIPSIGRLFLRNLFLIIWPIEFLILATNDEKKRLGDKMAKTVVVNNSNKAEKIQRILVLIGVGLAFFVFTFLFAGRMMKNSDVYKVAIAEIEQNQEILSETGGITGFGMMPTGNISISDDQGQAELQIKVLGNQKDLDVKLYLTKQPNEKWKLIELNK